MTQAKSVHSTPPTNTPIDTTRRGFLGRTVAALAAGTAVNVAALATIRPLLRARLTTAFCWRSQRNTLNKTSWRGPTTTRSAGSQISGRTNTGSSAKPGSPGIAP